MNKKAFTLVEIIIVIVIAAILGSGTYVFMQKMLERAIKAEFITQKSLQTQAAIDQLAFMLKARVVNSTLSYTRGKAPELLDIDANGTILEWIGEDIDLKYDEKYSGFADLEASTQNVLKAMDFTLSESEAKKYAIIFSGSDDLGEGNFTQHGWHDSGNTEKIYPITDADANASDMNLELGGSPDVHYEKYYLVKSGYAVTRGEELLKSDFNCNDGELDEVSEFESFGLQDQKDFNNTLFLFYDFQPWDGETFCADDGNGNAEGNVTILLDEVTGFEASYDGTVMTLKLEVTNPHEVDNTTLSKTKAVF